MPHAGVPVRRWDLACYTATCTRVIRFGHSQKTMDLDGIFVAETPWLLDAQTSLYDSVTQNWPQSRPGALGRLNAMGY